MKKYLFIVVLFFLWLFTFSFSYLKLQYKEYNLRYSQNNLAWEKQNYPPPEYEIVIMSNKLEDVVVPIPILLNKRTGITYRYFKNQDEKREGWFLLSWQPIEEQLKRYKEIENEYSNLIIYLFSSPMFNGSKEKYDKFLKDFDKYHQDIKEQINKVEK